MIVYRCDFCGEMIAPDDSVYALSHRSIDGGRDELLSDPDLSAADWHVCDLCWNDLGVIFGGKDSEKA